MMEVTAAVPALGLEFLADLAYDFYGQRIATCTSDHTIQIWAPAKTQGAADPKTEAGWQCRATIQVDFPHELVAFGD